MDEANKLRRNLARYLAPMYRIDPLAVAEDCDKEMDPTGILLAMVRDEAATLPPELQPPTGYWVFGPRGTGG